LSSGNGGVLPSGRSRLRISAMPAASSAQSNRAKFSAKRTTIEVRGSGTIPC
jgi:hypothetical protein